MWEYQKTDELYHYGVPGMKWGRRIVRGHAGPGIYLSKKRQLAGDKRDLAALKRGEHLSIGFTKKRQAAYDKRDKAILEKRIAKNEQQLANKQTNNKWSTKKKIAVGVTAAAGALAVYGAVKMSKAKMDIVDKNSGRKYVVNTLTRTIRSKDIPSIKIKVDKNTINAIKLDALRNIK